MVTVVQHMGANLLMYIMVPIPTVFSVSHFQGQHYTHLKITPLSYWRIDHPFKGVKYIFEYPLKKILQ
jgi:hypothetical protein